MAPRVSSYYNPEVYTVNPWESLAAARNKMIRYHVRRLVVVDEEQRPVGILTVSDIAEALLGRYQSRPLDTIRVDEVMTRDPVTIEITKSVKTAAKLMIKHRIGGLPVVSADGKLVGIITKTDIVRAFADKFKGKYKVEDFMRPAYAKANKGHSVFYLWRLIQLDPSGKIIVVDENNRPIGVITKWDLANVTVPAEMLAARGKDRYRRRKTRDRYRDKIVPYREYFVPLAESIMTPDPITVKPDMDAAEAARIMVEEGVGVLPVVGEDGSLLGIVTKREYLLAVATRG